MKDKELPISSLGFVLEEIIKISLEECTNNFRPTTEWLEKYAFIKNYDNWMFKRGDFTLTYLVKTNKWVLNNLGVDFILGSLGNVEIYNIVGLLLTFLKKDIYEVLNLKAFSKEKKDLNSRNNSNYSGRVDTKYPRRDISNKVYRGSDNCYNKKNNYIGTYNAG